MQEHRRRHTTPAASANGLARPRLEHKPAPDRPSPPAGGLAAPRIPPIAFSSADLKGLQRTVGNRAVGRLLGRPGAATFAAASGSHAKRTMLTHRLPALPPPSAIQRTPANVGGFAYDSGVDGDEETVGGELNGVVALARRLKGQLEETPVQLVKGGDQSELEKRSRHHYESTVGKDRDVPKEEVFQGSVSEHRKHADEFASSLPGLPGGDTSQYNLWSGMGKPGEKKEDTPRGKAESAPGFVMQQTKDFASAIWEVRNVAGFIDSETDWPWDPGYHLKIARWLEEQQQKTGWPSEEAIAHKLDELRKEQGKLDSRVKVKTDERDSSQELIGQNRKVGDSIFEAPSANLAKRVGKAMVPVQSFGLEQHENPKATVQWQVEIPNVIKEAEALQGELNDIAKRCQELADIAIDEPVKQKLATTAEGMRVGALRYKVGARMLKTAIDTTAEEWRSRVGWDNAEMMRDGRTMVLRSLENIVGCLGKFALKK